MKTSKILAGFGLLTTALPPAVFAQVINRPSNERPVESSHTNIYIIVGMVVIIGAFFFFRSKGKS